MKRHLITNRLNKHDHNARIKRLVAHHNNPDAPVDAATLLRSESYRIRQLTSHKFGFTLSWAFEVAAAKLDAFADRSALIRYRKLDNPTDHNDEHVTTLALDALDKVKEEIKRLSSYKFKTPTERRRELMLQHKGEQLLKAAKYARQLFGANPSGAYPDEDHCYKQLDTLIREIEG